MHFHHKVIDKYSPEPSFFFFAIIIFQIVSLIQVKKTEQLLWQKNHLFVDENKTKNKLKLHAALNGPSPLCV